MTLVIGEQPHAILVEECLGDLTHGGRGIGNMLETVLINPLARALFDFDLTAGQTITVERLVEEDGAFQVTLA